MINALQAVAAYLQDYEPLAALLMAKLAHVADINIDRGIYWSGALPVGLVQNNAPPTMVVLSQVGGYSYQSAPLLYPRMYVRCYGSSGVEAETVYRHVWDAFHVLTVRGITVIRNRWVLRSAKLYHLPSKVEPGTRWPIAPATLLPRFNALEQVGVS